MLPYLLAAVGGYLIGTSSKKTPDEAILADGGETEGFDWEPAYDDKSLLEAVLKAISENNFKYDGNFSRYDGYEYYAKTSVKSRIDDQPYDIVFEVERERDEEGWSIDYEIEIDGSEFDYEDLHKKGIISYEDYTKIWDFFLELRNEADYESSKKFGD